MLYGVSSLGGTSGGGSIYRIDPSTAAVTTVHSFGASGLTGRSPNTSLAIGGDGKLYGTASAGGAVRRRHVVPV
jgi:uncharacterized repeat protein (TIGR03803 family)